MFWAQSYSLCAKYINFKHTIQTQNIVAHTLFDAVAFSILLLLNLNNKGAITKIYDAVNDKIIISTNLRYNNSLKDMYEYGLFIYSINKYSIYFSRSLYDAKTFQHSIRNMDGPFAIP